MKVFYTVHITNFDDTRSGDILYREASTAAISFGAPVTLLSGNGINSLIYTSSTHQTYSPGVVVLTTNESVNPLKTVGVLATDETATANLARVAIAQETPLVHPNPFVFSTTVNFSLSQSDRYILTLYDSKGRRIRVIGQGWAEARVRNTVRIDGTHLASGLYLVKIQTGWYIQTLKLLKK